MQQEFFLFRNYSKAIKDWLLNTCYLTRYNQEENILVIYATPARAFAKYIYPVINGQQIRPTISFHLSQIKYLSNQNQLGFVKEYKIDSITGKYRHLKPLIVYELTYSLTIRTVLASDMDILLYQLMTNSYMNSKSNLFVDGQWTDIRSGDPTEQTNLEPGDAQDKIIRYGIDLQIERAYLPREYAENIGKIEQVVLDYRTGDSI